MEVLLKIMSLGFDKNYKFYITSILITIILFMLLILSIFINIEFINYNDKLWNMYIIMNIILFALFFFIAVPITIVISFITLIKTIFMKNKNIKDWIILSISFLSFFILGLIEFFVIVAAITL